MECSLVWLPLRADRRCTTQINYRRLCFEIHVLYGRIGTQTFVAPQSPNKRSLCIITNRQILTFQQIKPKWTIRISFKRLCLILMQDWIHGSPHFYHYRNESVFSFIQRHVNLKKTRDIATLHPH